MCRNHSLVITFVHVKTTMRVKITICVYKSRSWVSYSHAYVSKLHSCEWKLKSACKITVCVWKSYPACRNQFCACWNHTCPWWNHIRAFLKNTACRNYTLRVRVTVERVEFTLCVYKSHSGGSLSHSWVSYSHVNVSKLFSCEWKHTRAW
jgi:hypothetical protein